MSGLTIETNRLFVPVMEEIYVDAISTRVRCRLALSHSESPRRVPYFVTMLH